MKKETAEIIKGVFDRIYDVVTVQLIGAVIFILILLTVKFIGGNIYSQSRSLYFSAIDSVINSELVTNEDNLINDGDENSDDTQSDEQNSENNESEITESVPQSSETIHTSYTNNYAWPLSGKITANFGDISNLFSGPDSSHTGIDIAAVTGTPIKAIESGVIVFSGYSSGFGNHIIIQHSDNISSIYAHCSELLYKKGASINKGDIIALVGSSGKATGPHLHLEITNKGKSIDPLWLLPLINNI